MIVRIMRWSQKGKKGLSTVNIVKFTHLPGFLPVRQWIDCCRSFTQSCLTLYNPMGWQHTRLPCPSPSPGVCSNLCPLSWWCHPTITSLWPLLLLPSLFPSIRVFPIESALRLRWPKYWSFSFSVSPSNEYSGLISFRIDCFDLLAIQGSVKSLLQHIEHLYASAHPSVPNTFEASCFFFFFNKVFGFLFLFFIYLFFYLFVFYYTGYSCSTLSSCGKTGLLFIGVLGLLNTVASLVAEHRL